jgi:hypothetical protein
VTGKSGWIPDGLTENKAFEMFSDTGGGQVYEVVVITKFYGVSRLLRGIICLVFCQ